MDATVFAHLRPKERTDAYAQRVTCFIDRCPVDEEHAYWRNSAYWLIIRSYRSIDLGIGRGPYQTERDQYRIRTKMRRREVRSIVDLLPYVDVYGSSELEDERQRLVEEGVELIGIYDAIIAACSGPPKPN
jgi:hypothetical protein